MTEAKTTHVRKPTITLLSVLLATFLLLITAQPALAQDENPVVLRVDALEERLESYNDRFELAVRTLVSSMGMPLTPDIRAELDGLKFEYLEQRVTDLVLLNEAERRGIAVEEADIDEIVSGSLTGIPEDQVDTVLADAGFRNVEHFRSLVVETELIQRLIDSLYDEMAITDAEISAWWSVNSHEFAQDEQVCASHILVEDVEHAESLLADLEGGADFAELAVEHSTDSGSGARGGELGCFGRGMMVAPFEEAAFGATAGELVGPVESNFGQHLILVTDRIEPGEPELEEFHANAENAVANEKLMEVIDALVAVADVETFPEVLEAPAAEEAVDEEAVTDEEAVDEAETDESPADEVPEDEVDEEDAG